VVKISSDETSFNFSSPRIADRPVIPRIPAHRKDILANYNSHRVLVDLSVVVSPTLPNSVPESYGMEGLLFRTAR
jgi:hypothetical protein